MPGVQLADRSSDPRIHSWSRGVSCNVLFNLASAVFDLTNLTAGETADARLSYASAPNGETHQQNQQMERKELRK